LIEGVETLVRGHNATTAEYLQLPMELEPTRTSMMIQAQKPLFILVWLAALGTPALSC
jgi:hypothetical protein